jgi:hypothetical protein
MVMPPATPPFAALPPGAVWPLLLGVLASVVACSAAVIAVILQRQASRRRHGPSSDPLP